MKIAHIFIIAVLAAASLLVPAVSAGPADVTVTSYQVDPPSLMRWDTGTLTVTVKNNGAESVAIRSARLFGDDIQVLSDAYGSVGDIGAGTTKEFTFTIRASAPDATHYPKFVLDFRDGGSLRYPIPVRVENTGLAVAVAAQPNAFAEGREADISLTVGNPRSVRVTGVTVVPEGDGFTATPSSAFIGTLEPDQAARVIFNITPAEPTEIAFRVISRNGVNTHETVLALPIAFTDDKRSADPVLTNIEVEPISGGYRVTGDVTNAGLESARSVVVTSADPAVPIDPFRVYVVGTLDSDDFSSFEVTFRAETGAAEVPLVIEYRDADGNVYTEQITVNIGETAFLPEQQNDGLPLPAIAVLALVAIVIAGAVIHSWRRV
ncbi:hypothetical protein FGU65_07855 [Methanoculleus sp. FWC-SCC1]|uniref:CARDB domain-containing protein n=1 Tax=Methanoculleus frigidifontis TaxID=2584085 RepID=A0ABT8MA42_9EURY|nr:hypothetical protein [Methanoculleus sp. FWC-SCC1]MDN7024799.1 hypothetical protein [Methanoculleus sp. FWC-SCC1]